MGPIRVLAVVGLLAATCSLGGCGTSHTADEADGDGGTAESDAGTLVDAGPVVCPGTRPVCHRDLGDGCCGGRVEPRCEPSPWEWLCPDGSVRADRCAAHAPECGGDECAMLTESECVGSDACAPLYDDFCCPTCLDTLGGCADCTRIEMYRCAPIEEVCGGEACTVGGTAPCGEVPDCSEAHPGEGWRCSVPGCVARVEAACREGCFTECVPVTAESCTAVCLILPPECPAGMVAEADGGCFTGYCIGASACEPAGDTGG